MTFDAKERFWMIYGVGQGAPTIRHESKGQALDEAKRLARNNPGITFVILEAVTAVTKNEFVIETMRARGERSCADDGIPF